MARIWQNGFETNSYPTENRKSVAIDNYNIVQTGNSSYYYAWFKMAPGSKRGGIGDKSLEFCNQNGGYTSATYVYGQFNLDGDKEEIYFRTYFKAISSNVSSTTVMICKDNAGKQLLKVSAVRLSSTEYSLAFYNHANTLMYDFKTLMFGEWIKIDFRLKIDAVNGKFQLKANDRLLTTWDGNTQGSNGLIRTITFGCSDNYGNNSNITKSTRMSFDDMAVNDTSGSVNNGWCGNGSIVNLYPIANGSINQFTPLEGTQNFENVDEEIPDGDATYNSSYSLEDTDLFKFEAPETINGDKVINAISIYSQGKYLEKPLNFAHVAKTLDQEIETCNYQLSNGYTSQSSIIQVNPNTNSKYTVDEFNNDLEIGYRTKEYE